MADDLDNERKKAEAIKRAKKTLEESKAKREAAAAKKKAADEAKAARAGEEIEKKDAEANEKYKERAREKDESKRAELRLSHEKNAKALKDMGFDAKVIDEENRLNLVINVSGDLPMAKKTMEKLYELQNTIIKHSKRTNLPIYSPEIFTVSDHVNDTNDNYLHMRNMVSIQVQEEPGKRGRLIYKPIAEILAPYKQDLLDIIKDAPQEAKDNPADVAARKQKEDAQQQLEKDIKAAEERVQILKAEIYAKQWVMKDDLTVRVEGFLPSNPEKAHIAIHCDSLRIADKLGDDLADLRDKAKIDGKPIDKYELPIIFAPQPDGAAVVGFAFDAAMLSAMGNEKISMLMAQTAQDLKMYRALESITLGSTIRLSDKPFDVTDHDFVLPKELAAQALAQARKIKKVMQDKKIDPEKTVELQGVSMLDGKPGMSEEELAAKLLALSASQPFHYAVNNDPHLYNGAKITRFDGELSMAEFSGKDGKLPAVTDAMTRLILAKTFKAPIEGVANAYSTELSGPFHKAVSKLPPKIVSPSLKK